MFPLSHTYVSTKVAGRSSNLLIFGSVLPDIATTSKGEIGRDKIHYSPNDFYNFVKEKYPNIIEVAIGVRLHSNIGRGADFYSDDTDIGFANIEGRVLVEQVKRVLGIDDERAGLVLAHNVIEASVDLNLVKDSPDVYEKYKDAIGPASRPILVNCLALYLSIDKMIISEELDRFTDFLGPKHLADVESIVDGIVMPLVSLRYNKAVDREEAIGLLTRGKDVVKDKYQGFLDNAVEKMKVDFKELAS